MKKAVILKHGGGELANQLWNYASIYAFSLYAGIRLRNPSFFEYHSFFRFLPHESIVTKKFSLFFRTFRRRSHIINRMGRFKYAVISKVREMLAGDCVYSSLNMTNKTTYLPPTETLLPRFNTCKTLYLAGWLFRNPVGLERYRKEIIEAFRPVEGIEERVAAFLHEKREKFSNVIGVHIRQGDYKTFKGGRYWIEQSRVKEILEEYLRHAGLIREKTCFIICSDGTIDTGAFEGLNTSVSPFSAVEDLFILSGTNAVVGSDSSFGDFAAYYGNIPHIIMANDPIDWLYYKGKDGYFQNKYCLTVQY
jgi:hypothetical protein